ncbi:terpenoid cyclases/protein prenyltransferase alpha-alpha toroid [Hysterangium stoloniferum]|nr:terpenoid cyclases/protein prenyltransferase alpha-alpha toroid [Hysterangium stoloniferum]
MPMNGLSKPPLNADDSTDYSRWRLKADDNGRHIWHYLKTDEECVAWPQTTYDKYWLGLDTNMPSLPRATDPMSAARNGFEFYKALQAPDGHWCGEYGGPMFLIPGLVIGTYVAGMSFEEEEKFEIIRYLMNRANPDDGGWGLHVEGPSTAFGTALNYVAARLLGADPDHPVFAKARKTLHNLGGATGVPAWGKFWLSLLNVYDWDGNNPIPPELWLLPDWLPIHPHRWWIHTRQVYIPMSYLYGIRHRAPEAPIILALRKEIYIENYDTIDWPQQRNNICKIDLYVPHTSLLNFLNGVLASYESCAIPPVRRHALNRVYKMICDEDENTSYQCLGPVNKMMNLVCRALVDGPDSHAYKMHEIKRKDFMWVGPDGMRMTGTNGSQLWDIAFISQALVESGIAMAEENKASCIKALEWLDECQIRDDPVHYKEAYRHTTKGAWPFSTREQGYTVSDCVGEGLKAVLYLQSLPYTPKLVSERRLCDAVDVMLTMQNSNGGFASYELIRGPSLLEHINPAEVFGNIMIEYNYPECTTSVITALSIFKKYIPNYRRKEIEATTRRAIDYLHKAQHRNGAWFGNWGISFTYATMFALESLSLVGEVYSTSDYSKRACDFLVSKQRDDGGWGESYKTCETGEWVEHENTQVVQTAWAVIALMHAKYPQKGPIEGAVKLIMDRQLPDGSWAQEAVEGIFNKTCSIFYPNFKFSFTIWALGMAAQYLTQLKDN